MYKITSMKHNEEFTGTIEEAITRAIEIDEEYQPAYGVTIEGADGLDLYNTDEAREAFAKISAEAIGTGADADGKLDGSDDWEHPSAEDARDLLEDAGVVFEFSTWADARRRFAPEVTP